MRLINTGKAKYSVSDHYHTDGQDDSSRREPKKDPKSSSKEESENLAALREDVENQSNALKLMFTTGVSVEPKDPLQAALWMEVTTRTKKVARRGSYISALLSDWSKSVTGKWEVPDPIVKELESVVENLVRHQEELMFVRPEVKEEFKTIAADLDRQSRYWVRRFVPTSDRVLIQPGQTDHLAYALFLIITEGDVAEIKDMLNLYLRYNHTVYIPDWVDVRSVVLYPVLLRLAEDVRNKLGSPEPAVNEDVEEEPIDPDAELGQEDQAIDEESESGLGEEDELSEESDETEPTETTPEEEPFDSELESLSATDEGF